jgi:hypothetical protein
MEQQRLEYETMSNSLQVSMLLFLQTSFAAATLFLWDGG